MAGHPTGEAGAPGGRFDFAKPKHCGKNGAKCVTRKPKRR